MVTAVKEWSQTKQRAWDIWEKKEYYLFVKMEIVSGVNYVSFV